MEDQLKRVFIDALGLDPDATDWGSLAYRAVPEWDSVAHMQLVAEIEDTYDVMLETDDVIGLSSFTVAREILIRYGVES